MKPLKLTLIISVLLIFSCQLFGLDKQPVHNDLTFNEDSLVIQKVGARNEFVIYTGNKIEVWLENKSTIKGQFLSFDGFVITIANGDLKLKIPIYKIEKIKRYGDIGAQILGTTIAVVGIGLMVFTITGIAVGLILVAAGSLSSLAYPFFFIGAVIYGGIGFGLYKGGDAIIGRKVNLKKGWSIIQPQ